VKALSIRSPWWWYILHHGKDIENRDWSTNFRGRVLIHVGKWWKMEEVGEDFSFCDRVAGTQVRDSPSLVLDIGLARGCIVGSVEIVDCVSDSDSPWFFGKYGFVLANPVAFDKPVPRKGALGFFEVEW
jgi:hypothetical protein